VVRLPSRPGQGGSGILTGNRPAITALRLRVTGVVQGVGFRPFVHRVALRLGLTGWVRNEAGEVAVQVQGSPTALQDFVQALRVEAPSLSRIDQVEQREVAVEPFGRFEILASGAVDTGRTQPVPADVATCDACLAELFAPANRRFRYPFITCTDCGPRFTVIEAVPYERQRTSMRRFAQCPACQGEFDRPADRRFHSESNSCPECGPRLWFRPCGDGSPVPDGPIDAAKALGEAAALLTGGGILAIRGLGGFHLAADATNESAVTRLRLRKRRETKPLAVMVPSLGEARRLAVVSDEESRLLGAPERPIVLLEAVPGTLAPSVHPGLARVGVMLAYTPVHHLLLDLVGRPLIMTSGNFSEEPIAAGIEEGLARLGPVADGFLLHDREIVARCDDSVVRMSGAGPIILRRARGYAPLPLGLPVATPAPLLAVGPHLKNTATLARGSTAFVTPHVGDLESLESLEHFQHLVSACQRLFHVEPEVVARDLHPGYLSTRVAGQLGLPAIAVQHHHAHIAAVLAEHGRIDRVLGLAFDGTGYGDDGAVWGAELLEADLAGYWRLVHLRYAPLPGGDLAARRPWRALLGYCSLDRSLEEACGVAFRGMDSLELRLARRQVERHLNAPLASSMGRLFDAAAALLGVRREAHYEGQAAMELEALAGRRPGRLLPFPLVEPPESVAILDPLPLLLALGERSALGEDPGQLAADFHDSVAAAAVRATGWAAARTGLGTVALGGGVFQNARLLHTMKESLEAAGLEVLLPVRLSPNDGAISYGQAAVAAAQLGR
jgi:hydrogenase maturation protein HypF